MLLLLLLKDLLQLYKAIFLTTNIKKLSVFNKNINLSLDELKLVAKGRNTRYYDNKSEKDFIKALREPKPKLKINKKMLEEIRNDFNVLRHKFSKEETDRYKKAF